MGNWDITVTKVPIFSFGSLVQDDSGVATHRSITLVGEKIRAKPDSTKVDLNIRPGFTYKNTTTPTSVDFGGYGYDNVEFIFQSISLDTYKMSLYQQLNIQEEIKKRKEERDEIIDTFILVFSIAFPEVAALEAFAFFGDGVGALLAYFDKDMITFLGEEGAKLLAEKSVKLMVFDRAPTYVASIVKTLQSKQLAPALGEFRDLHVEKLYGYLPEGEGKMSEIKKQLLAVHVFQLKTNPGYATTFKDYMASKMAWYQSQSAREIGK